MAPYKRARCETEDLSDAGESTNGPVEAKKSKTANGEPDTLKRKRPPRDRAEEQLLNRLDQEQYEKAMKLLPSRFELVHREYCAREKFWDKFYSTDGPGTFPERRNQSLNSRVRKIVEERRKSCPWYFWGLEGYTRDRFPDAWLCFYVDGDAGNASQDDQLLYPWDDEVHAMSTGSPAAAKVADKIGLWDLPSSEMEKSVEDIKMQIAKVKAVLHEKETEAGGLLTRADAMVDTKQREAAATRDKIQKEADAKIDKMQREVDEKCHKIKIETEAKLNEIYSDISKLEEALKEKESILEVQEITLVARRATDSYANQ
ncbi:hypothetical protein VE03_02404 [Pseudogymnoascus sp. 23342-1-I1]|nr:hypothetical protein VE03_02404 [Pseudogymnoascus sp. 23342-1-I1]